MRDTLSLGSTPPLRLSLTPVGNVWSSDILRREVERLWGHSGTNGRFKYPADTSPAEGALREAFRNAGQNDVSLSEDGRTLSF